MIPTESDLLKLLVHTLESRRELASDALFRVFRFLPSRLRDPAAVSLIDWMDSQRPSFSTIKEAWLYRLHLYSPPKPTVRNVQKFKRLIPFKKESKVLSNPALYRAFLRLICKGSFRTIPQEFILEFVSASANMPKPFGSTVIQTIIDSIYRFDPDHQQQILNIKFWQRLIESHTTIPHQRIMQLMQRSGVEITQKTYEDFILRNEDFEECNTLCELFFKHKVGTKDRPTKKMEQFSLRVYSHMIRLLCNYSPSDACEAFEHPSVRSTSLLAVGYLMGLMEARNFKAVIENFKELEKEGLASSTIWNIYVHALVKEGQTELATKLATESLVTHSTLKLSSVPSFISNSLDSFSTRESSAKEEQKSVPVKQLASWSSDLKVSPIYIPTPKKQSESPARINNTWLLRDTDLQPCKYLLDYKAFAKVASAMLHHGRFPPPKRETRMYYYGSQTLVEKDMDISGNSSTEVAKVTNVNRFPINQIIHFLRLGWYLNHTGAEGDNVTIPGYQLHPGSISLILRDIQRGHLQVTKPEFVALISALAELYPSEDTFEFAIDQNVIYQADIFSSSFISRIVFIGYLKSPRAPWVSVSLLRELQAQKGVKIDVNQVKDALLNAVSVVYNKEPVGGELRRVRHQLERSASVHDLAEAFNSAWVNEDIITKRKPSNEQIVKGTNICV